MLLSPLDLCSKDAESVKNSNTSDLDVTVADLKTDFLTRFFMDPLLPP